MCVSGRVSPTFPTHIRWDSLSSRDDRNLSNLKSLYHNEINIEKLFGHQLVIKSAAWPQNGRRLMAADLLDPFGAPKRLSLSQSDSSNRGHVKSFMPLGLS